jgi:hypothetical protein
MPKKAPRCQCCAHPDRARIELLHISGVGLDTLAGQFGINRSAIWRHMARHVSEGDKAAYLADVPLAELVSRAADEGVSLLDYYRIVRGTLMKQFQLAASVNDRRAVAALAGRLNEVLISLGGITGEMLKLAPTSITNNTAVFIQSPMFADLQAMLLQRLSPFPDALTEVVAGLMELEAKANAPGSAGPQAPMLEHSHAAA